MTQAPNMINDLPVSPFCRHLLQRSRTVAPNPGGDRCLQLTSNHTRRMRHTAQPACRAVTALMRALAWISGRKRSSPPLRTDRSPQLPLCTSLPLVPRPDRLHRPAKPLLHQQGSTSRSVARREFAPRRQRGNLLGVEDRANQLVSARGNHQSNNARRSSRVSPPAAPSPPSSAASNNARFFSCSWRIRSSTVP